MSRHGETGRAGEFSPNPPLTQPWLLNHSAAPPAWRSDRHRVAQPATFTRHTTVQWPHSESGLELAMVYEDGRTQAWTRQVTSCVARSMGRESMHCLGWNLSDFDQNAVLADAVQAATRADVIIVALYAAEELPCEFYAWVDAWLPRRLPRPGTLMGLVGVSEASEAQCCRTEQYLSAVARRADLDLLAGPFELPYDPAPPPTAGNARGGNLIVIDSYDHWGLNE